MQNRLALTFILGTVAIDSIGIGLIFPVMPDLLAEVTGGTLATAAIWSGVLATAYAAMQFLFGPLVGSLSDRFGRRPILLSALAVMTVDYLLMAVAPTVWLLLLGRTVAGVTAATHAAASAALADISEGDERARYFGWIGAAFGVGFVAGPLIGGLLATIDSRAPFWAAAGLAALNLCLGWAVLPETVTDAIRRPFRWANANPLAAFRTMGSLPGIGRLLAVLFAYSVAFHVYPVIWSFYGKARFGWDAWMVGLSLAAFGLCIAGVQAGLVGPALRRLGGRGAIFWGMVAEFLTFLFYGFVTSGTLALAFTPLAALGGIVMPALQGEMSKATPADRQGQLQGVLASLNAAAMIVSPLLMTPVFGLFTRPGAAIHAPGAPFLVAALLSGLCLILLAAGRERAVPAA
ncbi:TCR/Tet family MFS transporter [Frigidibacter oleivorans]|uniref:TCR/Tet family MFS transporter n=1 Tax=Frigidibacter oleivorans TaxID=2487129 RepID=UPI000F8CF0CE|nr:TCR/Tet family MFS transporter [Frigidibacter oleivorans]